jgi:hypothetical protein
LDVSDEEERKLKLWAEQRDMDWNDKDIRNYVHNMYKKHGKVMISGVE